jgi:penicillin G amidase
MRTSRATATLIAVLLALALRDGGAVRAQRSPTSPAIPGLTAPVRVVTDRYGVPHVRAASLPDLYAAWGWVSARDRLWQMLWMRESARGTTWRWAGNEQLEADGGAQLFEMTDLSRRIWERNRRDPAVRVALERYCAGVNAWMDACRRGEQPWPPEVERLRMKPDAWSPPDAAGMLLGMGALLDLYLPQLSERAQIAAHGRAAFDARHRFEGAWDYVTIPDASGSHDAPPGVLGAGGAGVAPGPGADALAWGAPARDGADLDARASNVFAVGAGRTARGRPLLANDPHLPLQTPSAFHVVHVTVPGVLDAAGGCVPGLPAIVTGRNARCAWGVTALSVQVTDLYADTLSRDGRSVRWRGGWAPLRRAPFDLGFRVLGVPLPVWLAGRARSWTPHGPVLVTDRKAGVALSARWAGATDEVDLGPLLGVERAPSAAAVCAAFRSIATPTLNVVAADVDGHVRYQTVGRVPRRLFARPPGALPGDGAHEWAGTIPADSMPAWDVPRNEVVVNANNAPDPSRGGDPRSFGFYAEDRALRIAARLEGARSPLTLADVRSVQNDVHSRLAQRVVPLLIACADSLPDSLDARMRAAVDTLRHWDFAARRTRVAPTLWRAWFGAYQRRSQLEGLSGLAWASLQGRAPEALRDPQGRPERPAVAAVAALRRGLAQLDSLVGPDPLRCPYGRAHRARFLHELGRALKVAGWEPPTVPVDGDAGTPCVGGSRLPWNEWSTHGPVFRHLVDLAVPDSSFFVLPPGNSGDPRSPHFRDLLERWVRHADVPLYLSWERIEAAKESEVTLRPGR